MKHPMRLLPLLFCALALSACGGNDAQDADTGATAISSTSGKVTLGVNSYLWHASLDTLRFMPLASADPFGGVIITDWYTPPQTPSERFKVNVYILGRTLRADGVRAAVFRQEMQGANWVDEPVAPSTATALETAILTRARQLRVTQTGE